MCLLNFANYLLRPLTAFSTVGLLLCFFSLTARAAPSGEFTLVIDPGHGGHDNGAVYSGTREADLVLKIAQQLETQIKKVTNWRVLVTRDRDHFISLSDRVKVAREGHADLFVSLHANSAGRNEKVHGTEFFFHEVDPQGTSIVDAGLSKNRDLEISENGATGATKAKDQDLRLILDSLMKQGLAKQSLRVSKQLYSVWKESNEMSLARLKQEPFFVLAKNATPSVLIEVGFMSHPQEVKKLLNSDYQDRIVKKVASALVRYKESLDKEQGE